MLGVALLFALYWRSINGLCRDATLIVDYDARRTLMCNVTVLVCEFTYLTNLGFEFGHIYFKWISFKLVADSC